LCSELSLLYFLVNVKTCSLIGQLSVSERAVDDIKNNYIIYLSTTLGSSIIKENKNKDSRLRKVDLKSKEFSSEVFLLLNKVL
jgi:hypothetical protein